MRMIAMTSWLIQRNASANSNARRRLTPRCSGLERNTQGGEGQNFCAEWLKRFCWVALAASLGQKDLSHCLVYGREVIFWFGNGNTNKLNGHPELLAHGLVLIGTYLLYPLRIIYGQHGGTSQRRISLSRLRIPAVFDPAPLLYPTLIPVFVALALAAVNPRLLVPNLILSIASIPRQAIPCYESNFGYGSMQWFLSTVPVAVFKTWTAILPMNSSGLVMPPPDLLSPENLTMLYPLHQALLPSLGYLTTTSLLPAELQLLSVSMINIYFLSASPQAIILKALLWIGGLSIFIICGTVLKSGVALARVPRWRFRSPRRRSRRGIGLLVAIEDYIHRYLIKWGFILRTQKTTDSDIPEYYTLQNPQKKRMGKSKPEARGLDEDRPRAHKAMPISVIDRPIQNGPNLSEIGMSRQRRHTLPSYIALPAGAPSGGKQRAPKSSRFAHNFNDPRFFMSLTEAQATVVKWFYASYVYAAVLFIIAIPVRIFVTREALHNCEPVGWALGYLLGDLSAFRLMLDSLGLDVWVPLPAPLEKPQGWEHENWIERFQNMGAANTRLLICVYCMGILGIGLRIVFHLTAYVEVDTRRKVFHGMMVVMFLPSILIDPPFAALALILVLAIFLLLDLFRASQLPPLSRPLTQFLAPYVDGRDHRGPVVVSHIFLLIGCATPLWLSLAAVPRTGATPWEGWDVPTRDLGMISGVVCVGMGDAAASLIGRRFGRRRWCWSGGKSLEGSLAFAVAVVLGLGVAKLWLHATGWGGEGGDSWALTVGKAAVAAMGASLTEAVLTGGNDNVIVPVILWLLVRGLGI